VVLLWLASLITAGYIGYDAGLWRCYAALGEGDISIEINRRLAWHGPASGWEFAHVPHGGYTVHLPRFYPQ
jgi:hypothetical protein